MKKTLIAIAALAATSAFAQSTVTLYGVVEQAYNIDKKAASGASSKVTGLKDVLSSSRFGMRGTEDLGGGLKANFTLEYGVAPDEAATPMNNRQGFVGLNGMFGDVKLGRQHTQIHGVQGAFDANGNATAAGWLGNGTSTVRASNAITYTTPSFSGLTAALQLGFAEVAQTGTVPGNAGNSTAIGLNYDNGPLSVKAANETTKMTGLTYAAPGIATAAAMSDALANRKATSIGASYNLGMATVMALSTTAKAGSAADAGKVDTTNFGVSVPMGAFTLNGTVSSGKFVDSGADSVKTSGYQFGANYSLSKRTTAYAIMGQGKAKTAVASEHKTAAIGIRHTF